MRKLAILILIATLFSAAPAIAAETNGETNQSAKQTLETKITYTLNDNFLVAFSAPKGANTQFSKMSKGSFVVNASAYTAAADECGKSDGITASGKMVQANHTLACPRQYALGTKIAIDGMGTFVCDDRGGAIKGNHFDIYMQTKKEAFAFGRRNLVAMVVE
jgi:3D (Asp-Asp-Asp) domain-containing protein